MVESHAATLHNFAVPKVGPKHLNSIAQINVFVFTSTLVLGHGKDGLPDLGEACRGCAQVGGQVHTTVAIILL